VPIVRFSTQITLPPFSYAPEDQAESYRR
jgi:hypothetical protein